MYFKLEDLGVIVIATDVFDFVNVN